MMRTLFQALFGSFFRKQKHIQLSEADRQEVMRMIEEANHIANRNFLSEDTLLQNGKERRKSPR